MGTCLSQSLEFSFVSWYYLDAVDAVGSPHIDNLIAVVVNSLDEVVTVLADVVQQLLLEHIVGPIVAVLAHMQRVVVDANSLFTPFNILFICNIIFI